MKTSIKFSHLVIFFLLTVSAIAGTFDEFNLTDQTPDAPLSPPDQTGIEPRYVSGFGKDNNFTVFFTDRNNSKRICFVSTQKGPEHFETNVTETNVSDYHFLVKDWPIDINGTSYSYRAWAMQGNDANQTFYVSNDLTHWDLISIFTIPSDPNFTNARGSAYYGFHDAIKINGKYYAFGESNLGQTMILRSEKGDDNWTAIASIGGTDSSDGPLELPSGVTVGWTPRGSFFDLGNDNGLGKIYSDPRDSHLYLAVNSAAKSSLSPQDLETAFLDSSNWTWNDDTTGPAANAIFSETVEHDIRETWLVPRSDISKRWILVYDADFGPVNGSKALGYATVAPQPCAGMSKNLTAYHWTIVSIPCGTGSNSIDDLLGDALNVYGTNWLMYEQIAYTGDNSNDMRMMESDDTVENGKGYWIITDADVTMKIDTNLSGLSLTSTESKDNYTGVNSNSFDDVRLRILPDSQNDRKTKVMIGNPFPQSFKLADMYYNHNGGTYYPMGDSNISSYVEDAVYYHDSSDITSDQYIAITPITPGFIHEVDAMIGFFFMMKVDSQEQNNSVLFPFEL